MSRFKPPYATTADLTSAVVQERDVAYDTTLDRLLVGDGVLPAGKPLAFYSDVTGLQTSSITAVTFSSGDATPSVLSHGKFITAGTTPITNFDDGVEGQTISIYRGASDIVITDNATIDPIIAGNLTLSTARPSATFRLASGVWKQVEEAGAVSAAMAPVVQAATTDEAAELLIGDVTLEGGSVFRVGASGDLQIADAAAGVGVWDGIGYFNAGTMTADALCYGANGVAHLSYGTRGIACGVVAQAFCDGTWGPGASSEAGVVAIFSDGTTERGGVVFGGGFHARATTTAGAVMRGIEVDTIATANVASKICLQLASPNADTGSITGTREINGTVVTIADSTAIDVRAVQAGSGWAWALCTIKQTSGAVPVTAGLWVSGGYSVPTGLDWRYQAFSGGYWAQVANNVALGALNSGGSIQALLKLNASDVLELAGGGVKIDPSSTYTDLKLQTGNAVGRLTGRYNMEGSFHDTIALSANFKWDTAAIDSSVNGTAMLVVKAANSGAGTVEFWAGAVNTAPTRVALFTTSGLDCGAAIKSSSASAGVGYTTGAGGAVTQATDKSTGVTLNKVCGAITLNNATLNAGDEISFTLTNSAIAATDVVVACIKSGATAGAYSVTVDAVADGSCRVSLTNLSAGNLGEAVILNYAVVKATAA